MKKIILATILYCATQYSINAQEATFNSVDFANAYFNAWNKTQMPKASEKDLENFLVLLTDDVALQHLPYQKNDDST